MSLVLTLVFLVTFLPFLWGILKVFNFYKKLSGIPTAPGRSLLLGHIHHFYKLKKKHVNISVITAGYYFLQEIASLERKRNSKNNSYEDTGLYKIYLGPIPFVVVTSPEVAEIVFKKTGIEKQRLYKAIYVLGKGLINTDGDEYKYHKRFLSSWFRDAGNFDKIDKHFHRLTDAMSEDGIIGDLCATNNTLLDAIISESITNLPVFLQQQDQRLHSFKTSVNFMASNPWLIKQLLPLFKKGRQFLQYGQKTDVFPKFVEEAIQQFNSSDGDAKVKDNLPTLMNLLIQEHLKNPEKFTKEDILGELKWIWVASFDTLSISLTYLLHEVGHRPDIQDEILTELSNFMTSGRDLTLKDVEKLPYLDAVVKESLRRHPPAIIGKTADQDIKVPSSDGKTVMIIPKGGQMFIDIHALNNNLRHWRNPEEFNPSRFFDKTKTSGHRFSHLSFSAGKRVCRGKKIAHLMLQLILAKVVQRYKIQSLNPLGSIREEFKLLMSPIEAVSVQFIERN